MMMSKNTNISIQVVNGEFKPSMVCGVRADVVTTFVLIFRDMIEEGYLDEDDIKFIAKMATLPLEDVVKRAMTIAGGLSNLFEQLDKMNKDPECDLKEAPEKAPEDFAKDFDELIKGFFQNLREEKEK